MGKTLDPINAITAPFQLFTSAWENERSIEAQRNNNRINREWQSSENALDREFQAQQQESLLNSQQDFQREMYDYQFDKQNEYNLPSNQLARLRAAGLNPAALLGSSGGLAAASGNSSVSVPSVPSAPGAIGSHSVQQSPQIQTPMQSVSQMFSSLAQMQDSIAHSKKADADVTWMENTLPEELDKLKATTNSLLAKARLDEATASVTEFNHKLQEMFGKDEKAAQVQKLMNESYAAFAKGQYDEAQTIYSRGLSMLNELEYKFKDEQYPILLEQAQKYNIVLDEQAKTERAKQANEYASAQEHKAGAAVKRQEERIVEVDADLKESTFNESVAAALNTLRREGKLNEKLEKEIQDLQNRIDWTNPEKTVGIISSIIGSIGSAAGAALGAFFGVKGLKLKGRALDLKENKAPAVFNYNRTSQSYERSFPGGGVR